jgi:quinol monooxygenase YgiN
MVAKITVQKGREEEFIAHAEAISQSARKDAGCLFYEVFQMTEERNVFYLVEQWQSEMYFNRHLATAASRRFEQQVKAIQTEDIQPLNWEKVV